MRYVDVQRQRAEQARSRRGSTGFWYDVERNPYLSMAAGLGLGIPLVWISAWWPLEPWGLSLIPPTILVARGIWQLARRRPRSPGPRYGGEKQLLLAIRQVGDGITPVEAALQTSLTVDEAEEVLSRLAARGHLHVEGREGTLFYVLPGGSDRH